MKLNFVAEDNKVIKKYMAYSHLLDAILRGKWFIDFRTVDASGLIIKQLLDRQLEPSSEILSDRKPIPVSMVNVSMSGTRNNDEDIVEVIIAVVPLHGTMIKYGTYCNYGTEEVAKAVSEAASKENVSGIILDIDSGGGAVDAIAPLVDAITFVHSLGKSVVAQCDLCASAAYYTAIHCDEIIANNTISSEFGSIGVMMQFLDYAKYYEIKGIQEHTIYSDLSSYKNAPYESARKGEYALIKKEMLNPLAQQFQDAVKNRRGSKLKTATEGVLNGKMFYAQEALDIGLIDSVGNREFAINRVREIHRDMILQNYAKS